MVHLNRIYTRSGDEGTTGLGITERVSKSHPVVVCMGEVDELNSTIGIVISHLTDALQTQPSDELLIEYSKCLERISNELFDFGADLSVPMPNQPKSNQDSDNSNESSLRITESYTTNLEQLIDRFNESLPELTSFILPGGSKIGSLLHWARTVCRRVERTIVNAMESGCTINRYCAIYLNRLSDLLFVMARKENTRNRTEILWKPGDTR